MLDVLKKLFGQPQPLNLAVIYIEYDSDKCGGTKKIFQTLQKYLGVIEDCQTTYFRVDNKYEDLGIKKSSPNLYRVGGDNSFREFSGWQKGIEAVDATGIPCDLVLITNEMFLKPGESFLKDYSTTSLLRTSLDHQKIIGRIDTTFQEYTLFGYDVSSWICTNCFFVPKTALDQLGTMVQINDNLYTILKKTYDPNHLLIQQQLTPTDGQTTEFSIEVSLEANQASDIRLNLDKSYIPRETGISEDDREYGVIIKEISINNSPCPPEYIIRGLHDGLSWSARNLLLAIPETDSEARTVTIKGMLPNDIFREIYEGEINISIFDDSLLYQPEAQINKQYQYWLVEWLTEKWHSRFELTEATWPLFTTKAAAILNESLLTAKFVELGYNPQTYGEKKYY